MKHLRLPLVAFALALLFGSTVAGVRGVEPPTPTDVTGARGEPSVPATQFDLLALGDTGDCDTLEDDLVASQSARMPGVIALLGDYLYDNADTGEKTTDMDKCFDPAWHDLFDRIRPILGNHDYHQADAQPFKRYFASKAIPSGGWYAYNVNGWRVYALNSECAERDVGGCGVNSAQYRWLRAELLNDPRQCSIAQWHKPRYSSSGRNATEMDPIWDLVVSKHVDIVLNGHVHNYERMRAVGSTRQFAIGTGGAEPREFAKLKFRNKSSQVRMTGVFGQVGFELNAHSYRWQFIDTKGAVRDSGSTQCR